MYFDNLWPEDKIRKNGLGSVLPVFILLAEDMYNSMTLLGEAILNSLEILPTPCFEDKLYLRTHFARHLHRFDEYKNIQWISPESVISDMLAK